jgi:cellulose biosynthesis protein BcsQ/energy-coupling factor transporter ATP-binding protein EcfA2
VITTFYSYKGGVGRSMALANVADLMARSGLRVLVVDFDLEAPGLEHFFPIDHERVRSQEGLLDLLLAFKHAMSVAADDSARDSFRDLDRFLATVYPTRDSSGGLDLLPAGRRSTAQEIVRYGAELRRFDWLDFYFTWSGELFFEWLRRTCADRYDAVLVDSRTGVTEMGGVCAYQLADAVVVLCAPNLQNVEGTDAMVRHFLSPDVRAVRGGRAVDVLIVPSRVDQADTSARAGFERRFAERFDPFTPPALLEAGETLWSLQIPYDPRYAFDEQVVADPSRVAERRGLAAAYGGLLQGIARLAPPDSRLSELSRAPQAAPSRLPVETLYDPTTRSAAPDVYLSAASASTAADLLSEALKRQGLVVATAPAVETDTLTKAWAESVRAARVALVLVDGARSRSTVRGRELDHLLARERPVLPVLLPGADPTDVPAGLAELAYLDLRSGIDDERLATSVRRALASSETRGRTGRLGPDVNPYPGARPYGEADASFFHGRDQLVEAVVERLERTGLCLLVGPAGSGKTSTVRAGLLPALKDGRASSGAVRKVVLLRLSDRPFDDLERVMSSTASAVESSGEELVLVVDQAEDLLARVDVREACVFLERLLELVEQRSAQVVVVLRTESLGGLLDLPVPALSDATGQALVLHGRLTAQQLHEVIERPAAAVGLAVEPGLSERIVADAGDGAGSLALLQFLLHRLVQDNQDGYLTHRSYDAQGGVLGVLHHQADGALAGLSKRELRAARVVLLRLVAVNERGTPVRRVVERAELVSYDEDDHPYDHEAAEQVVHRLEAAWLLIAEAADRSVAVQLAHEALLSSWPRLHDWIEEEHAALRARTQLVAAVEEWERRHRDPAAVLGLDRLLGLTEVASRIPLTAREQAFVDACYAESSRSRRLRALTTTGVGLGTAFGAVALTLLVVSQPALSLVAPFLFASLIVVGVILSVRTRRRRVIRS